MNGSERKFSEGCQLLREIVDFRSIPPQITNFWDNLARSARGAEGWNVISVLNTMSERNRLGTIDLMAWYEILRDIYVMRARAQESLAMPVKVPRFTTFDRTFEQLAFLPEYWFGKPEGDLKSALKSAEEPQNNPSELLFSFERYMYDQEGGGCWSALDWGMAKYCFRVVCEPARKASAPEPPLLKLASMLLAARHIVTGEMGLYIGEKRDVDLPYAGITGGGQPGSSLLKYYHFDRFTRFSFIRRRELLLDADSQSTNAKLEPQWQALAAMTEFILSSKSARATKTTCARVGVNAFIGVFNQLRSENALGGDPKLCECIDKAIEMLDSPDFARMPPETILREIGVSHAIVPCDFYLRRQQLDSAEKFWSAAGAAFKEVLKIYDSIYFSTVGKFTAEEYARRTNALIQDDCAFLRRSLACGHLDELRGRMTGLRLRSALKTLLATEQLELNCGQMAQMLNKNFNSETLMLYMPAEHRDATLPWEWMVTDIAPRKSAETIRQWVCDVLSELSRDPKTGEITKDYAKLDLEMVQRASDRLWEIYFSEENESACRDRWMLSLATAIRILEEKKDKLCGIKLPHGSARKTLLETDRRELAEMSGGRKFDLDAARARLTAFDGYSLASLTPGYLRNLAILDLIARLMVTTAEVTPFDLLWSNPDELKTFFTHLLCATGDKLDYPLPFHIGIYSDALLRLSRNNNQDQRDNIDRLLKHRYDNGGERCVFLLMLLKYLQQTENPTRTLDAVIGNPAMAEYASRDRLIRLREFLGGK